VLVSPFAIFHLITYSKFWTSEIHKQWTSEKW
jgi:hypothetical protein